LRKYGFESIGLKFDGKHGTSKGEENVQKACPRGGGEPSNKAAVAFVRGTYIRIRERSRREERQVWEPEGHIKWREHCWWAYSAFSRRKVAWIFN
jgi:hypothetical protein